MAQIKIESREQALLILKRCEEIRKARDIQWGNPEFPEQLAFINENAPLAAALCTRRAGKSYAVGEKLFKKAYDYPGSTVLYLALTRGSAERIMWRDVIMDIVRKRKIPVKTNATKLEVTIPNGSVIKLGGADADQTEREKLLGGKYPYVAIDEAGSFANDLSGLIYEYLEPCVADYDGSIDLIGTPTFNWQGFFCKVTEGKENGWKIHKWNTTKNPFMPHWQKRLQMMRDRNPNIEETPGYRRMYLGEWVYDTDNLIYKFQASRNFVDKLPDGDIAGQILGVDLGFNDATAYVLSRYYENDKNLYFVNAWKKSEQIVDHVIETLLVYINQFSVRRMVFDNASKQVVETIKSRFSLYGIQIEAAEKKDKIEFIDIMNSDFIMSRIKLLRSETQELAEEYSGLIKDPNSPVVKEHEACDNHLCDAALYAWRLARNYLAEPLELKVAEEDRIEMELEAEHERQLREQNDEGFGNEWGLPGGDDW